MRLIFTFVLFIAQFANAQNFDALKPGMSFTEFRRANPGAQIKIPNRIPQIEFRLGKYFTSK
jgi:hypothetical protein